MQKMNAAEIMILTRESNIVNRRRAHRNIIDVRKFERLMMFRVISEESRKVLKSNKFSFKNVVETVVLRRDHFDIVIYKMKIKKIS